MQSQNTPRPVELLAIVRATLWGGKINLVPASFYPRSHVTSAAMRPKLIPSRPASQASLCITC